VFASIATVVAAVSAALVGEMLWVVVSVREASLHPAKKPHVAIISSGFKKLM